MKLFFDGGCRPNPGTIEIAVVALGVTYFEPDLGFGSNNDAEWLALIHALRIAARLGAGDVQLLGDSATIIDRASGAAKWRDGQFEGHRAPFESLRARFVRVRFRRIKRSQNLAGIALAKRYSGR